MDKEEYIPYKGFYDLREFALPKRIFKKLWKIQEFLFHMQTRAEYFREFHPTQWEEAKQMSGEVQQILFSYGTIQDHEKRFDKEDKQLKLF